MSAHCLSVTRCSESQHALDNFPMLFFSLFLAPVEKCMSSMQMGTQMVKLRGGSKGLVRFFFLDEHKSCIRWRPSRKNEKAKSEFPLRLLATDFLTSPYNWLKTDLLSCYRALLNVPHAIHTEFLSILCLKSKMWSRLPAVCSSRHVLSCSVCTHTPVYTLQSISTCTTLSLTWIYLLVACHQK